MRLALLPNRRGRLGLEITMYSKKNLVLLSVVSAVVLLASTPSDARRDRRDRGNSVRQTLLDDEYARRHPTIVPGTPPRLSRSFGYVPPRQSTARQRRRINR